MTYVVTGDNHLTQVVPRCRKETDEEWLETQYKLLNEIIDIANENDADLVFTGDTFDTPRVAPEVVSILLMALMRLRGTAHFISGNHEKQFHREANVEQASIGIIKAIAGNNTGKIRYYTADEYLVDGRFEHSAKINNDITIVHTLTFPTESDIPFSCTAVTPEYLFQKYNTAYIFTGDMHKSFYARDDKRGQMLVNPGCMSIQSVSEMGYAPGVYLVDDDTGRIQFHGLDAFRENVTNDHITEARERDARIAEAIEVLKKEGDRHTMSFLDTLTDVLSETTPPTLTGILLTELKQEVLSDE